MAKQYKVLVNTGKEENNKAVDVQQGAGDRGQPVRIKAQAGAKYQLQEMGRSKPVGPDYVKARRVGKDLHILFEDERQASLIIEDYYGEMAPGYNGVIGQAENGSFYEYIPEDPRVPGLIPELAEGGQAVNVALGGAEVTPVGAAVAVAAFPLLGALGLLGAGAAAVYYVNKDDGNPITGALQATAPNDSGTLGDNRTNDNTPTLVGKVPAGATATVTINGQTYPVIVAPDGSWTFTQPTNLPDGTYTPILNVTQNGSISQTPLTPFIIDTVTTVDITNPGKAGTTDPISGNAEAGDTVVVKDADGNVIGTTTAGPDGKWSLVPIGALLAGPVTATATDAAGNVATDISSPPQLSQSGVKTALTIDPITGDNILLASEQGAANYSVTGKVTGQFAAGDVIALSLNGKTFTTLANADGSYSMVVPMVDLKADPDTRIEGTVTGTGGDTATAAQDYTLEAGNTPTQTALSLNPVTADNILSAAEAAAPVNITGKVTGPFSPNDTVTVMVGGKPYTGKPAADGTFSIPVPGSDLAADPNTTIEATITGTGGTPAAAMQDYGLNTTQANGVKTALSINPISGDNILLASEQGLATLPVTGKVTGQFAQDDLVMLSLNGKFYTALAAADGSFSVLVATSDLKADQDTKIEGTVTGTGGDTATAAQDYTLEAGNTPTQTALSLNPVTADNILSAAEAAAPVNITGKVTGPFSPNDTVTVMVGGKPYTGKPAADGTFSIPVPGSDLAADPNTTIEATITGTGGTPAAAMQDYGLNTTPTPVTGALAPVSDNTVGTPNDNKTKDPTPELTGTAPAGSTAVVNVNGVDYPVSVQPDGTWAFTQPSNLPDGTYYPVLKVTQNGVTTPHNLTPFTIDTTPPTVEVKANTVALAAGQTATITFTLSEASSDFTWNGTSGDIVVTGGTLSALTPSTTDPKVYTATFTPTPGSAANSTATISVASGKFADAAGNNNVDTATNPAPAGAVYEANNSVSFKTNATITGALQAVAPNDSGALGDNLTNDTTPTLAGKVPAGSTATVTLGDKTYPATVDAAGNWTAQIPDTDKLPDGTYTPVLNVTKDGQTQSTPITPFTIDTTPPTIELKADASVLTAGETATVTFVLSEPVKDFSADDIVVTGGTLGALTRSSTDPTVWTATFTPASTGNSATISVASGKFSDAAANLNNDGAEANNKVTLSTNATVSGSLSPTSDNATGTPNDNKANDPTPELTGSVPAGSTATVTINGQTYPVDVQPDGSWTFTQPTNLPDGTYTPVLNVTKDGQTQSTPVTPFTIDTTPPSIAVSTSVGSLSAGQNATITFTLSEAVGDFTSADISVSGGSLGPLVQSATDPKVYTALFMPASTGTSATISVASNKFSDAAGNNNIDTATNPAPTGAVYEANNAVTLATNTNAPVPPVTQPTGALDPASDSGVMGDNKTNDPTPTITGEVPPGSSAKIKLNGKEYPVDVKPDGSYSFTAPDGLPDGTYTPELIVTPPGATTPNAPVPVTPFTIDTKPPTIAITADKTQLLAGQTTVVTFTVSEAVSDFVADDIQATGGTLGTLTHVGVNSNGEDVYTAVFTPTTGSTATSIISVGSGKFSDAANNFNTDGDEVNNTLMLPTNTVVGGGTGFLAPNSDSGTPGDNVTNDDTPTITGKVPPGSTASVNINGKDYPVTVNPDGSYSYTIPDGLPDGTYTPKIKVTPQGGGTPVESDGTPFTIDTTPPTVLVTSNKTSLSTGQTATITFTLSEDSSDFTLADVTPTGGTLSNLQGSGKVYTATFTPSANSTATSTVKVDSLKFSDAAGNFNTDGAEANNTVSMATNTTAPDTTAPTIAISADRSSLATGQTTLITFTLSEASSNFTADKVTFSSGSLSGFAQSPTNPLVYTATYTPAAGSTANSVISVASAKFSDAAGNNNADGADANNTVTLPTNTTPGLVSGALDPKSDTGTPGDNKTLDNTPTISGTAPPGSKVEVIIDGKPYTGTADENGQYSINVPDALPDGTYTPEIRVTPPGGPTSSTDGTPFTIDTTAPTILVASDKTSLSAGQTATITFTLSEASSDFTQADIAVTGGTLSNWQGSGTSYTAIFTPTAGSTATSVISVASDKFSDAAGNFNADGADTGVTNTNIVRIAANTPAGDTTPPTILVERTNTGATTLDANSTETILFKLSEPSTTFGLDDIDVRGGQLSGFIPVPTSGTAATGYTQYTAVFTPAPNSSGTATVGVASGRFTDNAGNANKDTYVSPAPTGAETQLDANNTNQVSLAYNTTSANPVDTDKPTIQVSIDKTSLAAGQTATLTFILSEASTDFTLQDIDIITPVSNGGSVSNLVVVPGSNGAQYTATYTAGSSAGAVRIGVDANKFADAAGNTNADTYKGSATGTTAVANTTAETNNWVQLTNTGTSDTTPPTVAVSRMGSGTVGSAGETIVFTFSEGVPASSFMVGDIDAVGGNMSNLVPVETSKTATGVYTQYTATFVPTAGTNGTATIGVLAGKFTDVTGNLNKDTYTNPPTGTDVYQPDNQVTLGYDARTNPAPTDTTAPTIAISAAKTTLNAGETTVVTFTLSEPSSDFLLSQNDIATTGGTLSNFQPVASSGNSTSGHTQYTATFTPTGGSQGAGSVHVDSNAFRDAANNYNADGAEANNTVNFITNNGIESDTTPPTIEVLRLGSGTLTSNETIQFTLSEASKDFTLADIVVLDANGNPVTGTLSNFAAVPTSGTAGTGYTTYVATLTAPANASGSLKVAVASSKFSENAGNLNQDTYVSGAVSPLVYEDNNHQTISYNTLSPSTDTTPPTVIVGRDGTGNLASGQTDTITFTLSEASLTFDLSDVTVKDAQGNVIANALTNFAPVAASGTATGGYTVYTATFTPASGSGTATIGVESDKFTDLAGNKNKDTYLTGVANTSYEANNKVDIGYNTTTPSTDTTPPTVEVLRSGTGTMTGPETIYFNFSEPVATTSFTTADISYTGGQISNLVGVESSKTPTGAYTQYIATFTPTAGSEGVATIGVKAGTFADAAGNNNQDTYESGVANTVQEDNNIVSASYDTNPAADITPPTVAISRVGSGTVKDTDIIVFVFSEPVSNFALSDVVNTANGQALDATTQGALSNLVGVGTPDASGRYTQYKATYTAPTNGSVGTVTLGIKAGTFNDAASNTNKDTYEAGVTNTVQEANNQLTLGWNTDTTTPTIGITRSGSGSLTSGTDTITFTLSEPSSDFAQSMVDVVGGILSNWTKTGATTYEATFTPNSNSQGSATISVDANKFHDLANNANQDSPTTNPAGSGVTANQVNISYDTRSAIFGVTYDANSTTEGASTSTTATPVTGNVLTNDNLATAITAVGAGTSTGSSTNVGTTLNGTYGTLTLSADGSYTYTLDNSKPAVQALKAGDTVNDIFTYTARDSGSTTTGSANLVITITGTNDAPVAVADTATAVEAGGTANGTAGTNPTGNVLTNDTDVDTGDTKTVSAISGGTVGTAKAGTYGSLTLNADGSYSYTLTQGNAAVEALLPTSTPLTDTFTYTVKDSANATHTATLTVSITGANDAPTVTTAIADKTGTVGTALTPIDVTSNFADVDTSANGETATYSAKLVDSAGNLVNGGNLPSWLQLDAATGIFTGTPPAGTAAGDIYIRATRTDKGGLSASDDFKITLAAAADTTPPTVAITSNQASLSSGQTATITFTFSEAVTGFAWDATTQTGDIDVSGGTLSALTHVGVNSSGQDIYTATFTPTASTSTTGYVAIAAGKFTDTATTPNANVDTYLAGANFELNNVVNLSINTTVASSLTLVNDTATAVESGVTSGNTAVAGTNPSGNVKTNDTAATSVTQVAPLGGSDSAIAASSTSASNGTTVNGLYGSLVIGADGTYTYTLSNSNPTVNALQVGSSLTDVFTYTATDGKTANLTVTINGTDDAPTVSVPLIDQNGTEGAALSYTFDSGTFADVDTGDTKTYTATFADGTALTGSWLSFNATTRTFSGTPPAGTGTVGVRVTCTDSAGATASDNFIITVLPGNANTSSSPTVVVARSGTGTMTAPETITFTLSEPSISFEWDNTTQTGDIVVTGGTLGALTTTDNITYTAIFTPASNTVGAASVGVKAGVFSNMANSLNEDTYEPFMAGTSMEADNIVSMNVNTDVTPPTIAISQITSPVTGAITVTFTLSEASADFTAADVYVTPGAGTLSNWTAVSGTVYTATFTPTANSSGNVTIGVAAGKFADAAGLRNKDTYDASADSVVGHVVESNNKTDFSYNTDTTPPTIAITGPSGAVSGPTTITFTLSEVSTDFAWDGTTGDIVVTGGGTLSAITQSVSDPKVYTATYTPPATSTGTASISVASDKFSDTAANLNKDGGDLNNQLSVSYDTVSPTVVVTRATSHTLGSSSANAGAPYTTELVTFTLSEASSDFTWNATTQTGSITVSGGTLGALTHVGVNSSGQDVYTATFTPASGAAGTGTIGVAAGKFHDAAGNANADTYLPGQGANTQANNQVSVAYDTQVPTQTVSFGSMTKDSALSGLNNNDWLTADSSAGRLVSGFLSAPLAAGETVQVFSNGTLIGNAVVNDTGTAWAITDTKGYGTAASWTYTAKVVDAAGNGGPLATRVVNGDYTEAAPVITAVTDSASASVAHNGTTANTLGSISGTGVNGNTVYVYDNTGTNLVGSAVVANGTWTITGLNTNTAIGSGINTFAAKQVDPLGNESVLSNLWTVTSTSGTNALSNPDFTSGATGFTTSLGFLNSGDPTSGQSTSLYTPTDPTTQGVAITTVNTPTVVPAPTAYAYGSWTKDAVVTTQDKANPDGTMSGRILWGQLESNVVETIWSQNVSVVAGQTYTFKFDYFSNGFDTQGLTAVIDGAAITIMSPLPVTNTSYEAGHFIATYTATTTKTMSLALTGQHAVQNRGDFMLDNMSFMASAPLADNSLTAGGTPPATPNPDTLAYNSGTLDAEGSDDLITVASTALQTTLSSGGFIDGGAGIDTLKLAAGTTLNLETLTGTQTVSRIQEVEIFQMQGGSTLRMSANSVLSLGGANASTMAPFTFASTQQVSDTAGGVTTAATGSTSSTGKVQMVIQGTSTDTLKLDSLLTDGIANGTVLGNSGLAGTWAYKGTVQIGLNTYKVYDHSTTQAQVLVDVPVIVNAIDPITIVTIVDGANTSSDTGVSATDFVTSDTTLVFKGTVPNLASGEQVKFELLNASGQAVTLANSQTYALVTPSSNTWTYNNTTALASGTYTIKATIVDSSGNPVVSYGSLGIDTHPLVIDTTLPTVVVTRATSNTLSAGQSETITFTLSEASTNFTAADVDVTNGTLINFSGSGTTYTATYVPASGSGTGTVKVNSAKFSDAAGNQNADGADVAAGTTNIVSIDYLALPTQSVSFSSMTKDSGLTATSTNSDWLTNDGSAGRLVSGTLSAPLSSGQKVQVFANGTSIGFATVAGQAWEITDLNGYTAGWTYTAKVVDSSNNAGPVATQVVNADFTEAAPQITAVTDSANASIAHNGATTNTLSTVSGTGNAGNTIYLYDNTGTNLVGTTTVASNGTWSISGLAANTAVGSGSNVFSARQVDALGNASVLSNLWTVSSVGGGNIVANGDFSAGNTGFTVIGANYTTSMNHGSAANQYAITTNLPSASTSLNTQSAVTTTANTNLKWSKSYNVTSDYYNVYLYNPNLYSGNPNGKMAGSLLEINLGSNATFWQQNVNVEAGKTYTFEFDYQTNSWGSTAPNAIIDGTSINFVGGWFETGHFKATYTATETKTITLSLYANNAGNAEGGASNGDAKFDNFSFTPNTVAADSSLTAGGTLPFTSGVDGVAGTNNGSVLTYTRGAVDMLGGDDVLNAPATVQTLLSTSGNVISGGAGVDTLKLAIGTTLDLTTLTSNQTVKPIEQVEVFQMQGASSLTLSANDVLSLGGSNASTMAAYTFSATTGGASSASSAGKVQMVINGTTTDALNLTPLALDGVTTNGVVGNTGLGGEWVYMGTTTNPINGVTYKVYNHSTTQAQVLTNLTASTESAVVGFTTMTKDSSLGTANSDWFTADGSAGRLVSGTLAAPLGSNTLKVYANGSELPASAISISADGLAWSVTDTNGYNANWVYRADVVNSSNVVIGSTTQVVTTDLTEAAPVITSVTDSASTGVAHNGSTTNTLSTVSGTGVAGDTIYLYDNSGTNLVGTTTVAADGTWSISGLATNAAVDSGSNTFSARMIDSLGNASVLSNLWTVTAAANVLTNGDFSNGLTGWTTYPTQFSTTNYESFFNNTQTHAGYMPASSYGATRDNRTIAPGAVTVSPQNKSSGANSGSGTISLTNYEDNLNPGNPDGKFTGYVFSYNNNGATSGLATVLSQNVNVVAGETYKFSFDYTSWSGADLRFYLGTSYVNFVTYSTDDPNSQYMDMGYVEGTFTATTTGTISLAFTSSNMVDFSLDNLKFAPSALAADGSLVGGGIPPFTSGVDGVASVNGGAPISYTGGVVDMLEGDDVLNIGTNAQTLLSTSSNLISGSAGVDTLKLAAGTSLNLTTLGNNQTVKPIEQVEVIQMQGGSSLTMSANDVLSLGGSNASTMLAYAFASTTGGSGTTSSTGKVQMVVNGTASDVLDLTMLNLDGVTTNGVVGNTGLAGAWSFMGTTTIGSTTYKVYNHSTTQAQVLVNPNVTVNLENPIAFTSMTKDSGTLNADWTTADGSAGRLVSGVLGVPLLAGQTVEVYSGTTLIGTAQVAANGTSWAITDTTAYNANWSYTAKIMSGGSAVSTATQAVTLDNSEAAPVISAVVDSASATIANNGTSTNSLTTVSGTGLAGDVLYLYDNSSNNLVGTTVVGSNGTWSISGLQIPAGSNTFAARQVDAAGNQSVLSNLYVVNSAATNLISNGDLSQGNTGFTSTITNVLTSAQRMATTNNYAVESIASGQPANIATATTPTLTSPANYAYGNWTKDYITGTTWGNPDGSMAGNVLTGNLATATPQTVWATSVNVVAGKTYTFTFDYALNGVNGPYMILWLDNQGIEFQEAGFESGHFTATYTATETQSINLSLRAGNSTDGAGGGDFWLDNFVFRPSAVASDNTLTAAGTPPATPNNDGVSTPLNYTSGILDALAGNDLITANSSLVANLAAGGRIMGGAGVDTLKLASNTSLNLEAFTRNQTVTPIQEVEIFQLQGGSTLTLSANDVLSLGGANLSGYSFAGSAGKVQLVVNATNTDTVNLTTLSNDGVSVGGTVGNTGLEGAWSYAGLSTIGGSSYKVYNHSTTQAQVLVLNASVNVPSYTQAVTIDFAQADAKSRVEDFNVLTSGTVDTASTTGAIETDSWSVAGYWGPSTGASAGTLMASSVGVFVGTTGVAGVDAGLGTDNYLRIGNSAWTATTRALDTVFTSKTGEFNSIAFKMGDLNYQSSTPAVVTFYDAANNVVATVNWYVGNTYDTFSYDLGSKMATKFKVSTTTGDAWYMDELTTTRVASNALTSGSAVIDTTPRLTGSFTDPLAAGDVVQIYEGSTLLGNATVDTASKTWSFQLPSSAVGAHTYSAVISSGSGSAPVTSNNFTLNVLASPLALDLNGDGVQTLDLSQGVLFDLLASGTVQSVGWVDKHDGLLAIDLNYDGQINSGAELLGTSTRLADGSLAKDGWQALAQYDANADSVIDAQDAVFKDLKVWVDANSDGVTDQGELRTLVDLSIQNIHLNADSRQLAQNGNILEGFSSYTTADGQHHQMADAWLQTQSLPTLDLTQVLQDGVAEMTNTHPEVLRLNVSDVLQLPTNASGQHVLQVQGDANDVVSLSNLLADGHATGTWGQSGTVTQNGHTYNVYQYSGDASLQVLIDQHIAQTNVHVG